MGEAVKIVAKNNKAYHDYFIEEKYETGIELAGTEVKSIRLGNVNLKDSFCLIKDGELSVLGMHVIPLSVYFKGPRVKLEIGLAKGKKLYDKREASARRDAKREMDRVMKTRNR